MYSIETITTWKQISLCYYLYSSSTAQEEALPPRECPRSAGRPLRAAHARRPRRPSTELKSRRFSKTVGQSVLKRTTSTRSHRTRSHFQREAGRRGTCMNCGGQVCSASASSSSSRADSPAHLGHTPRLLSPPLHPRLNTRE